MIIYLINISTQNVPSGTISKSNHVIILMFTIFLLCPIILSQIRKVASENTHYFLLLFWIQPRQHQKNPDPEISSQQPPDSSTMNGQSENQNKTDGVLCKKILKKANWDYSENLQIKYEIISFFTFLYAFLLSPLNFHGI